MFSIALVTVSCCVSLSFLFGAYKVEVIDQVSYMLTNLDSPGKLPPDRTNQSTHLSNACLELKRGSVESSGCLSHFRGFPGGYPSPKYLAPLVFSAPFGEVITSHTVISSELSGLICRRHSP